MQDRTLPPPSVGEICVRGASITPGYWNDPETYSQSIRDQWFHTGDVGYLDSDGYLYITDRKKDLIIKGGENISPREIEEVIYLHPSVAEAAVVGVPDDELRRKNLRGHSTASGRHRSESEIREHIAQVYW